VAEARGDGTVLAPMPGTVVQVSVSVGDRVSTAAVLGVLEAMKMEISLKAAVDGVITTVDAAPGDQVSLKQVLFEVSADEGDQ
jgi:acetyl-CoA/propionyl-CoA carboxylase biotin carboxyl carrier protein